MITESDRPSLITALTGLTLGIVLIQSEEERISTVGNAICAASVLKVIEAFIN